MISAKYEDICAMSVCRSVCPTMVNTIKSYKLEKGTEASVTHTLVGIGNGLSIHRIWYRSYKSNRYTGVFYTRNVRFTPNLIFRLLVLTLNVITKTYLNRLIRSGTCHISQIGIMGSWAHGTFDSHQI